MEVATRLVAASPHGMLDRLFEEICECVQLTDTQFELAQSHYYAVGEWLAADESPLAIYKPWIYPQGSARHKTTVKPIARQEHDVDLVCHLDLPCGTFSDPRTVFELVAMRLRQNGRYKDKLENYKRCIRLNYASEFHLDITPARPDALRGGQCILVPDRKILRWEAWAGSPRAYRKFVDYLFNFRSCVRTLLTTHGVPAIAEGLNQLFGESLTKRAVASFTERFERNRQAGLIGFSKDDVGLMVTPASAPLVGRLVPRNTFHGV
jgi:hypothetical protein